MAKDNSSAAWLVNDILTSTHGEKFNPKQLWERALQEIELDDNENDTGDFAGSGYIAEPIATKIVNDIKFCHKALRDGGEIVKIECEGKTFTKGTL